MALSKQTKQLIMFGAISAGVALLVETFGNRIIERYIPAKKKVVVVDPNDAAKASVDRVCLEWSE